MSIYLQGSWPACISAGILLLSKARRFGMTLSISIVQDSFPHSFSVPALMYSPLLVGLGIPQSSSDPAMVILPGKSNEVGYIEIQGKWCRVDRSGQGFRPETKDLMKIILNNDRSDVELQQEFFGMLNKLGLSPEPAMFDLFFEMADMEIEEAFRVFLFVCKSKTRKGESFSSIRTELNEDIVADVCTRWEQRLEGTTLGKKLADFKSSILNIDVHLLSLGITAEVSGIQRSIHEFLGTIGSPIDPFQILHERYKFLGGKFVEQVGRGYVYTFPDSTAPTESIACFEWLKEQAEIGSQNVEEIWQAFMQPTQ